MVKNLLIVCTLLLILVAPLCAQFEDRGVFVVDGTVHPDLADGNAVMNIARVGDLNGDSIADLAFALHGGPIAPEGIIILSGSDGILIRRIDSPAPGNQVNFGSSIIGLPDINGDGVDDLLVVASLQINGAVHIISGLGGSLNQLGPFTGSPPFFTIASQSLDLGDVDGDGFDDGVHIEVISTFLPFLPPTLTFRVHTVSACGAKNYGENLGGSQTLTIDWIAGG